MKSLRFASRFNNLSKSSFSGTSRFSASNKISPFQTYNSRAFPQSSFPTIFGFRNSRLASTIKFTKEHEWIKVDGDVGTVGITNFAQEQLGDVVYVELPKVGSTFKKGDVMVSVESVKAASDVYIPVSGKVLEVNKTLETDPSLINKSAEDSGWMSKIQISNKGELDTLMDANAYKQHIESEKH